jgi:hypothetical protein
MFALMPYGNIITTMERQIFKGPYCSIIITFVILVMVTDFFTFLLLLILKFILSTSILQDLLYRHLINLTQVVYVLLLKRIIFYCHFPANGPNSQFVVMIIIIIVIRYHLYAGWLRLYVQDLFQNQPPIGWLKKYKIQNKISLYETVTYITALLLHILAIHI